MQYDVLILGGGVVGCALAYSLCGYEGKVALLERGADLGEGASKANSGIVHAGFDAKAGTLKARLNVEGARMYPSLCETIGAPYGQPGALVLGFTEGDRAVLQKLYDQGIANGVEGLRLLTPAEVLEMEPNINPEIIGALYAPTSGITSPYEVTYALADTAALNGVEFHLDTQVVQLVKVDEGWEVQTTNGTYTARAIVNCAGLGALALHNQISKKQHTVIPRKGQYYLLDRLRELPFYMTMFQCPTAMGKGVLVSPTVHGNLLLGPTAEDITDPEDTSTTAAGLKTILDRVRFTWPGVSTRSTITTFSGVRAHETGDDFVIGPVEDAPMAFEALGIESPGLTAAPAIGKMLAEQVTKALSLREKSNFTLKTLKAMKPFHTMSTEERAKAVAEDPENGNLICRCEQVTEAEIRAAIRRPVGARTIDAVKHRTRAGMGRCQGGFCSPRVLEILSEELSLPPTKITKNGGASYLLVETIAEAAKEEGNHA